MMRYFCLLVFAFNFAGAKEYSRNYLDVETGYNTGLHESSWPKNNYKPLPYLVGDVRAISTFGGSDFTCALDDEGVKCWGDNSAGQIRPPSDLKNVRMISTGAHHACALDENGMKCWGANGFGQTDVPSDLKNVRFIATGGNHSCAIYDKGVECWGDDSYGQSNVNVKLKNVRQISAGMLHTCALDDEGVKCWGEKRQRGVPGFAKVRVILAGGYHSCLLNESSEGKWIPYCWGDNSNGQIRLPSDLKNVRLISPGSQFTCAVDNEGVKCWGWKFGNEPSLPSNLKYVREASAGKSHICVLDDDGIKCWGENNKGQLRTPSNSKNIREISGGFYHTCALEKDDVRCWGWNSHRQLEVPSNLKKPRTISAGTYHTCALDEEGIKCWGQNDHGECQAPSNLKNITMLAADGQNTCVLYENGIKCWGRHKNINLLFNLAPFLYIEKSEAIGSANAVISSLKSNSDIIALKYLQAKLTEMFLKGQEFEIKPVLENNLSFARGFYFENFKDDISKLKAPQDIHFRYLATVLAQSLRSQKSLLSEAGKRLSEKLLVPVGDLLSNREIAAAQTILVLNQIISEKAYIAELENSPRLFGFAAFYKWFLKYAQTGDVEAM